MEAATVKERSDRVELPPLTLLRALPSRPDIIRRTVFHHEKTLILRGCQRAARAQRDPRGVAGLLPPLLFLQPVKPPADLYLLGRIHSDLHSDGHRGLDP